jgi:hypothetical protein
VREIAGGRRFAHFAFRVDIWDAAPNLLARADEVIE